MTSSFPISPSKAAISGWFKHLKKADNEVLSNGPGSPEASETPEAPAVTRPDNGGLSPTKEPGMKLGGNQDGSGAFLAIPVGKLSPRRHSNTVSSSTVPLSTSPSPAPSRPFMGFRSSSSHSFRPLSQIFDSGGKASSAQELPQESKQDEKVTIPNKNGLRSHRDSFLQQQRSLDDHYIFGTDIATSTKHAFGTIYISADLTSPVDNERSNGASNDNDTNTSNTNSSSDLKRTTTKHNVAYGKVPLVVVSCGSYLKANGLDVEGIFRLAGSNKRVKHLQVIFSQSPDYGAKLKWEGYTVHDAASLLRRYLSSLSEPLIPLSMYESFRTPLIQKPELMQYFKAHPSDIAETDKTLKRIIITQRRKLLKEYSVLFSKLPAIQRRVLFYLLDMLAMFDMRSENNRMPSKNLAAIFQPSVLFHPDHDMNPDEYSINSLVVESMITYSHKILTAIQDEKDLKPILIPDTQNKAETAKGKAEDEAVVSATNVSKPKIVAQNDIYYDAPLTPTKNHSSSPIQGSPLKNMVLSSDFDPIKQPVALSSNKQLAKTRPYSKSLSHAPNYPSEMVKLSKNSNNFNCIDEPNLTPTLSNQSELLSNEMDKGLDDINTLGLGDLSPTCKEPKFSNSNNDLIKELGLPSEPDALNECDANSEVELMRYRRANNNIIPQTITKRNFDEHQMITPLTPGTLVSLNPDMTPTATDFPKLLPSKSIDDLVNLSTAETDARCVSCTKSNEESVGLDDTQGSTTNSVAFSFQPSILSKTDIPVITTSISPSNMTAETPFKEDNILEMSDFKPVEFTHPDIVNDSSMISKSDTASSFGSNKSTNNEDHGISVKKRNNLQVSPKKDDATSLSVRSSSLFSKATHKLSLNLNRSDTAINDPQSPLPLYKNHSAISSKSSLTGKDEESHSPNDHDKKQSWFGKLRSRSNTRKS